MNFSIVIPVFNEQDNIIQLVEEIHEVLKDNYIFELIIVNDFSNDGTLKILNKNKQKYNFKILNNESNLGQSYSLIKGIENSNYDTIITLDGDLQNDPKDIIKLIKKYFSNENFELVSGIRLKRNDKLIKILSSKIANAVRRFILNDGCKDTGCSLKIFNKNTFITFPYFNGIHRFLPALFKGFEKKVSFIEVNHRPRLYGFSKYNTISRLIWGIRDIIRVIIIIRRFKRNRA